MRVLSGPRGWRTVGLALGLAAILAACSSTTAPSHPSGGGVVTFAEEAGTPPTYILPLMSAADESNANLYQFTNQMFLPLYWFGDHGEPVLNQQLSLAHPPVFSDNNTVATVTLKHWVWSNGKPVTARDVIFWMNLLAAVTDPRAPAIGSSTSPGPGWFAAVPGGFPENLVSYQQTGTYTVVFRMNASYNPTWFLYNELSQISPLPQAAWDRLSSGGAVGNYDTAAQTRVALPNTSPTEYVPGNPGTATSGALGVAQFLNSQALSLSTYASNPLWQVVDGPFHLTQFTSDGFVKMVPNRAYSGSPKPRISAFELEPFTSDSAEFDALRSGSLSIGYIPPQDYSQKAQLEKQQGYSFSPWYEFQTWYGAYNFTNPTVGPILSQLYFRQAFQSLLDQPQYIKEFDAGIGSINQGPVPTYPPGNPDESPLEKGKQIYPFDPTKAVRLLRDNGWTVIPGGTSYCSSAGVGAGHCGNGVRQGQKAQLTMLYLTGSVEATEQMEALQSALRKYAGIDMTLTQQPFADVISTMDNNCTFKTPCPAWQLANWNFGWSYSPDYFPTGGEIFATGAASNGGDYSNPTNDGNIRATHTASTRAAELQALFRYEDFLAVQLPAFWLPNIPFQFTMYKSNLHGVVPQDVFDIIYPQEMYFS